MMEKTGFTLKDLNEIVRKRLEEEKRVLANI